MDISPYNVTLMTVRSSTPVQSFVHDKANKCDLLSVEVKQVPGNDA